MKNLLIVESPTKAKTISRFLDKNFDIQSSYGHVRDLPEKKLGVDIKNNFQPQYVVFWRNQKRITTLKKSAQKASLVYFATDEDREGEAISWHLSEIFKLPKEKIKRIVFHEITKEAILEALKSPRQIDLSLVDAQQARRVLDRLVGYKLSPFLWSKVAKGLSAGRVQSVAVRLIIEREREIQVFVPQEYWTLEAKFSPQTISPKDSPIEFSAQLYKISGKRIDKFEIKNETRAKKIIKELEKAIYLVEKIEKKNTKRSPAPPFTTASLQREASRHLGFSVKQTMIIAQQLYEGIKLGAEGEIGLITYMRTDSVNLAEKFLNETNNFIKNKIGKNYAQLKKYQATSKLAQEAHEAIRPTFVNKTPELIKKYLNNHQFKLYQLIWQRAIASQMADALTEITSIDIVAQNTVYNFLANGTVLVFDGFLKVYPLKIKETQLPKLKEKENLDLISLKPEQHFTQPPARYSDASLIKALEEYGIGRPSTYAPTITTIQERGYIIREDRRLKPAEIAFLVNDLLVQHFPKIVNYQFTALMEDELDDIAQNKLKWQKVISDFWHPFKENLDKKYNELSKKEITEEKSEEVCPNCGQPMVIKLGRFGKFLACSNFPECKTTQSLDNGEKRQEPETTGEKCPDCGNNLVKRQGKFGEFIGCSNYPNCKYIKKQPTQTFGLCPKCQKGQIVARRSRRGWFYSCNLYPDCKFALWGKPYILKDKKNPEICPDCNSILVYGPKDTVKCSNKECKYKKVIRDE